MILLSIIDHKIIIYLKDYLRLYLLNIKKSKKFNNYLIYSEHSRKMISLEKYFKFNSNSIKCLSKNNQFAHKYNKKIFSKFYITKEKA